MGDSKSNGRAIMRAALVMAIALAACAPAASSIGQPAAAAPAAVVTPLIRARQTISGQPLRLPQGPAELVAAAVEIPAGGATAIHQHPWSRFVYVERGTLRVINRDTGETRDFTAGQVLPEVVGQWHEGRANAGRARLIVLDLVPPGASNMVMR